ncbi:MAG TPA: cellulose-binding domain-containing protein [Anaerolineae bacterium]
MQFALDGGGTTITPGPTNTSTPTLTPTQGGGGGYLSPSTNAAQTGGDGNGYQTSPANAHANGGGVAVDTNSGTGTSTSCTSTAKDRHNYYNYNIPVPGSGGVAGIAVRLDAFADSTAGSPQICVQLSWNGGTTWTATQSTGTLGTSEQTFIVGGPTNTWGRTWSLSELSNANFRVRVIDVASNTARDFSLDWVGVQVYFTSGVPPTPTPTGVPPTATSTPGGSGGGCGVAYVIRDQWSNGFTADVTITNNGSSAINGWTLGWTFPGNQQITNLWNGSYTQSGQSVSVTNAGFNATIGANGGTVMFGFNANYSGTNAEPATFTLNGTACTTN